MIKIDVEKINNWDIIKEKHSEWYKENILPKIEKACKFLESKKNKGSSVEKYLNLLNRIKDKGKDFVVEEVKKNFENRKNEKEFYEILFDKNLIENLKNDLKKHSKWYEDKILLNIENACKFLEFKKYKEDLIEKYLDLINKMDEKGNFEDRKKEKKFYEILFDKNLIENLKNDLKKYSKWYEDKILLNIENACKFLEFKKYKEDLVEKYLDLLNKIEKRKKFVTEEIKFYENLFDKNLVENFKKEKLPKKYFPNKLFHYEELYKGVWNRHELLSLMGIEVCPYCQRNYISNYEDYEENNSNNYKKNKTKKTTAHLDHFYPKSLYPFLALSLYNFIPSCQVCNSRLFKGNKDTLVSIYPYEEGFDELGVKFKTSKEVIYEILGEKDSNFSVKIDYENLEDEENKKKVENSIGNLGLDRVYKKSHNQYIQDLLYTIEKYPENYLEACGEMFENDNDKKKQLEEYFKDIVKEPYRKRIENGEPLAKLTKDILEEFDIKI